MSGQGHKHSASSSQNHRAQLANAYNELGKELSSSKIKVVGNYTLGKVIGEGAYGKVRLGTHRLTSTRVAIKQIPKSMSAALTREIHHHRRLHHPHICQLYEVIATESHIWLVTELCSGGELFDYLAEKGRLNEEEARIVFGQLCLAVGYIHDRGVVHRDLKLENVLLDERCRVKLGDFGFTREFEKGSFLDTYCGTTGYAAPEMLMAKKYLGPEVDLWSLGIIFYCLLTGTLPFDDDDESRMREKIIIGDFDIPEWLSSDARDLIRNILQYEPSHRLNISQILAHPWFHLSKPTEPVESPEETAALEPFNLPPKPKPLPSPSTSNSSFHSASSAFSQSVPSTPDDFSASSPREVAMRHRNNSESTIKKSKEDGDQRKSSKQQKKKKKPDTVIEEEQLKDTTHTVFPSRDPSPSQSRSNSQPPPPSLFPTRTPARTKRRSVSSVLSQPSSPVSEGHIIPLPPQDYAALLLKPAPLLFSTPLERTLLNNLSTMGFDIGQMVHSVLSDACDSSGAMWWMLKRKSEKKALEEQFKKTLLNASQLDLEAEAETELDIPSPLPAVLTSEPEQVQYAATSTSTPVETSQSAPELAFVPATPTVADSRQMKSPSPPLPVTPPRSKSPRSLLSPTPTSMDSSSKSTPSTPSGSGSKGKNSNKPRSGSVSIMQRATTALEAAGLVRKKSTEAVKEEKERKEDKRASSSIDSRNGSSHGSGPARLQKSPPTRPVKDTPIPSTPEHEAIESELASPWVIPVSKSATFSAPTPTNSPGDSLSPLANVPSGSGSGGKPGSRNRTSILTTFKMWFNDDRKGKRKALPPPPVPATPNPTSPSANRNRGSAKRRGTFSASYRPRAAKRASVSSRRSSSVNSRRSSVASVTQMIILEPPHYNGGEQIINISRQRSDPSRRSFTPVSEAERGEHPSRPSSVHSYRVQTRQHKKSPSASSGGSNAKMAGSASPLHKYHRRAGSTSSTRVVRQSRPSQSNATPVRPSHVRSSSTASSIHSLHSSRPGSFYEASESENQRTNSPLPSSTRRSFDDSSSRRTVLVAQKRQTPFLGPIASGYNSSMRSLAWKKAWGIEPPGWSSRSTQPPVEVLAILPGGDQGSSFRDVITGRQSISMGDEDDWVDEEDDVTLFASGFGQPSGSSKTSSDPPMTLSPPPRISNRNAKGHPRNTTGSRNQNNRAGNRSKPGQSPVQGNMPLPGNDTVFDAPSEPPPSTEPRMARRQLPARSGPAFRTAIQEEDEGEE
ncbi:Pkinase-domain-containing protein [Schizopora paradoxa]|uniref:Pkinase-domain-containing protein n=1 Tax=Schizopora paradoxa TaxID=27342 RepID=A0A0H2S0R1_9AGAM|nr:Pkinase-domain-containing protein [Schizopora paradoxa]